METITAWQVKLNYLLIDVFFPFTWTPNGIAAHPAHRGGCSPMGYMYWAALCAGHNKELEISCLFFSKKKKSGQAM